MKFVAISGATILAAAVYAGLNGLAKDLTPAPLPPVLEFTGTPVVTDVSDGKATIAYQMRRNESCVTSIQVRWYNLDKNGYDAAYRPDPFNTVPAPVTDTLQPFSIRVVIPDEPGKWAYDPLITPSDDCNNKKQIQPPFAVVEVK